MSEKKREHGRGRSRIGNELVVEWRAADWQCGRFNAANQLHVFSDYGLESRISNQVSNLHRSFMYQQ